MTEHLFENYAAAMVLSHLLKHIRIFDILKEIVAGNNV
ncbi:hypothetical protein Bandiella_00096 [Candidatus Bandiella woodruffii]|uniref:Uncharacterized protein n=1 Tax=Candidatus Bandiella euplotis TaxID=1664265 RepID=A0ABZ0UIT6_9RICK|nr:hypothetical protein Bandiella_00096 [Candidatus Bandiella woodruffii]